MRIRILTGVQSALFFECAASGMVYGAYHNTFDRRANSLRARASQAGDDPAVQGQDKKKSFLLALEEL
jgi:histidine ammonia-lyase